MQNIWLSKGDYFCQGGIGNIGIRDKSRAETQHPPPPPPPYLLSSNTFSNVQTRVGILMIFYYENDKIADVSA